MAPHNITTLLDNITVQLSAPTNQEPHVWLPFQYAGILAGIACFLYPIGFFGWVNRIVRSPFTRAVKEGEINVSIGGFISFRLFGLGVVLTWGEGRRAGRRNGGGWRTGR